jgi:hypothetical protein
MDPLSRQQASVNMLLRCARGYRQIAPSGSSALQALFLPLIHPFLAAGKFGDQAITGTRARRQLSKRAAGVADIKVSELHPLLRHAVKLRRTVYGVAFSCRGVIKGSQVRSETGIR